MLNYKIDLLKICIKNENNKLLIIWTGECISKNPEDNIAPMLKEIIVKHPSNEIIFDFKKLSFINSACISMIVLILKDLKNKNIKVSLEYDDNSTWQSNSFKILQSFISY